MVPDVVGVEPRLALFKRERLRVEGGHAVDHLAVIDVKQFRQVGLHRASNRRQQRRCKHRVPQGPAPRDEQRHRRQPERTVQGRSQGSGRQQRDLHAPRSDYAADDAGSEAINGTGEGGGTYRPGNDCASDEYGSEGTNWYIADVTAEEAETEDGGADGQAAKPVHTLSDAGRAVLGAARSLYWNAIDMDRLAKRLGEARHAKGDDGLWLRVRYDSVGTSSGRGDFDSSAATWQAGLDRAFSRSGGRLLAGAAVDWRDADVDFSGLTGDGDTRRFGVKAYATWLGESGAYADLVAQWGRLSNSFRIVSGSGTEVTGDFDSSVAGFSAEAGHKLSLGTGGWFAEPEVQLQYLHVSDGSYRTSQGSRIAQDSFDSVLSRAGVRAGRVFGAQKASSLYVKADWIRE